MQITKVRNESGDKTFDLTEIGLYKNTLNNCMSTLSIIINKQLR